LRLSRNRSCATQMKKPDVTEPVIGRAFTRPVWLIQATLAARVFVLQYGFRLRGGGPIRIRIQVDGGLCRSAKRSAFPLAAPSTVLVHSRGLPKARLPALILVLLLRDLSHPAPIRPVTLGTGK
jgi:hypothetical protein